MNKTWQSNSLGALGAAAAAVGGSFPCSMKGISVVSKKESCVYLRALPREAEDSRDDRILV